MNLWIFTNLSGLLRLEKQIELSITIQIILSLSYFTFFCTIFDLFGVFTEWLFQIKLDVIILRMISSTSPILREELILL